MSSQASTAYVNLEAERSVLSAAMQSAQCVKLVSEIPSEEFHDPKHKVLHLAIKSLAASRQPVDLVTLNGWLGSTSQMEAAGGVAYIAEVFSTATTTANVKAYIQIIHECSIRRTLYLIGKQLMERSGGADAPDEVREWAARAVKEVRMANTIKLISMQDACFATYEALEKGQEPEDGSVSKRINSGITLLDQKLGGIRGSEYVAIGARPSVGKSILALTFCVQAAMEGKRVLLVSLEMTEIQITERVFANTGNVPLNIITSGRIQTEDWMKLGQHVNPISQLPIWYCLEATTVDKVRKAAYQLYENGGLDLIAIDYLQLMEASYSKRQNRQEQISEISRGLRMLALELDIPILVLTQLNRSSESTYRGVKQRREPTMSEARESGAIEQDASIFMLLHDPHKDELKTDEGKELWDTLKHRGLTMMRIIVEKNRQGKKFKHTVAFDGDHMRFLDIIKKEGGEHDQNRDDPD